MKIDVGLFSFVLDGIGFCGKYYIDVHNLAFFFFGICLVDYKWFYDANKQKKVVSIISLILLIVCGVLSKIFRQEFFQIDFITLYPMIVFAWLTGDLFITERTFRIEKISFYIYCTHYLLQILLKRITYIVLKNNTFSLIFGYFVVNIIATVAIIYLSALFLNKFVPKLFKIISGGRTI